MEDLILDHGLAQKLTLMENAAERIATIKAQLRANTDETRKHIRSVMSQQMLLLHAREEELMEELYSIASQRERALEHQQQSLYKLIWECSKPRKLRKQIDSSNSVAAEVFSRLAQLEIPGGKWANISFEWDAAKLQSTLSSFGTIHTTSEHISVNKNDIGENPPMECDEHDGGAVMAQKSVFDMKLPENLWSMSREQLETTRKLSKGALSNSPVPDSDMSPIMAEFELIKNSTLSESESSDSTSSFEPITEDSSEIFASALVKEVLSVEFLHTLQQPLSSWLMRVISKDKSTEAEIPLNSVGKSACSMKRPHSDINEKHYEFEDVINSVRASSNDYWVLGSARSKRPCIGVNCNKEEPSTSEQEFEAHVRLQGKSSFNENEFLEQLTNLFVTTMKCAPHSTIKEDPNSSEIDLSTVLGWKRVLEKIEQSASFWLRDR
ncbi:hypothetical protein KIN20_030181 [Parelaphostrongylus tenuis]|uniref:Uncharacterized protein n=1 Tax=Parelaphostrongylus tenuis TaxID=148309 RepID=A0AAD5WG63_PARTN|nr:hypothetical protein KIN20_030181 [Parelaphostrongylus tenuis]